MSGRDPVGAAKTPGPGQKERAPRESGPRPPSAFTAFGLRAEAEPIAPGLHVVATPIGNLRDITLRALATLAAADAVIAEDTRVSHNLLAHYGITSPLIAYHEHNAAAVRPHILARLAEGAALALISDAGTPLVSDPGYKLVGEALAAGVAVTSVPGPSAVLAALVVGGLPTDRFFFEGFLPPKSAARRARINELALVPATLVFFESPRRLAETLADLGAELETTRRGALSELAEHFGREGPPRGEIVVLVGPPAAGDPIGEEELDRLLRDALETLSVKDAAGAVSARTGAPRRQVYARALVLAGAKR
jgi:16S rRNA (cytidine1402-2'-O)-methyltransferase